MRSRTLLLGAVLLAAAVPVAFLFFQEPPAAAVPAVPASSSADTTPPAAQPVAEIPAPASSEPARMHVLTAATEGTVEDVMRTAAQQGALTYTAREYASLGSFIVSIDGLPNQGGTYWMLYINGMYSSRGMSQAAVHPGDSIEWRYE